MLGALDADDGRITPLGRQLLDLPVHPRLGRLLVAAARDGFLREGAALAALLSEKDIVAGETSRGPGGRPAPRAGARPTCWCASTCWPRPNARGSPRACATGGSTRPRPAGSRRSATSSSGSADASRRPGPAAPATSPTRRRCSAGSCWPTPTASSAAAGRATRPGVMVGGRGVRLGPESVVRDAEFFVALDPRDERRGGTPRGAGRHRQRPARRVARGALPRGASAANVPARFDDGAAARRRRDHPLVSRPAPPRGPLRAARPGRGRRPPWPRRSAPARRSSSAATRPPRNGSPASTSSVASMPEAAWPDFDDAALAELLAAACAGQAERRGGRADSAGPPAARAAHLRPEPDCSTSRPRRRSPSRAASGSGSPTRRTVRPSWPSGSRSCSAGPRPPGSRAAGSPSCSTSWARTSGPSRSPTTSGASGRPPTSRSARTSAPAIPSTPGPKTP